MAAVIDDAPSKWSGKLDSALFALIYHVRPTPAIIASTLVIPTLIWAVSRFAINLDPGLATVVFVFSIALTFTLGILAAKKSMGHNIIFNIDKNQKESKEIFPEKRALFVVPYMAAAFFNVPIINAFKSNNPDLEPDPEVNAFSDDSQTSDFMADFDIGISTELTVLLFALAAIGMFAFAYHKSSSTSALVTFRPADEGPLEKQLQAGSVPLSPQV